MLPEANLAGARTGRPRTSSRRSSASTATAVFGDFARQPAVTAIVAEHLGPDVDCFLIQFIFKNPGAWGQPWHQD